jgi:hypothetical protein
VPINTVGAEIRNACGAFDLTEIFYHRHAAIAPDAVTLLIRKFAMTKPPKFSSNRMVFLCSALHLLVPGYALGQAAVNSGVSPSTFTLPELPTGGAQ